MPGTHSLLSPSSAKRWGTCLGSVPLIRKANARDRSSADADLGTRAHNYAEQVLNRTLAPEDVPADFRHILTYTEYCQTLQHRWGGMALVEQKVRLFYRPEDTGTVDFALLSDHGLFITDYKNGVGEPVDAEDNPQLGIYALSLIDDPDVQMMFDFPDTLPVELAIVQPRYQGAEPIKVWTTTVAGLREFLETYRVAAQQITAVEEGVAPESSLPVIPSYDACRWCDVKHECITRSRAATAPLTIEPEFDVLAALEDEPEALFLPATELISDRHRLAIVQNADFIRAWLKDVEKEVFLRAVDGNPVEGTKLVIGREGNRDWGDSAAVAAELGKTGVALESFEETKLRSPAQVEKILKEHKVKVTSVLKEHIVRAPGKPKLVLASDPRPALLGEVSDLFDEEPNDDE